MDKRRVERNLARIREVLMHTWDPIGVRDIEEAADEYDAYAGRVHHLLFAEHADVRAIATYLFDAAHRHMGIPDSAFLEKVSRDAAAALVALKHELNAE